MTARILVTGSRRWKNAALLEQALDRIHLAYPDMLLVHGDCPTGADRMAQAWAELHVIRTERHPADWSLGKAAGPKRNQEMVNLGVTAAVAFIDPKSTGTRDCVRRLMRKGIQPTIYEESV